LQRIVSQGDGLADAPDLLAPQSRAFKDGGSIPLHFTADGENISPPLFWSDAPEGTASLLLIVDGLRRPRPSLSSTC